MTAKRKFEETHPWLTFSVDLSKAPPPFWLLLGEARSKCEHLAWVPLKPATAEHLHQVYLAKGVLGTTAIEGNTLTEEQVEAHLKGELELPESQEYLRKEIENILEACSAIDSDELHDSNPLITPELIKDFNRQVLDGLIPEDSEIVPGEVRRYSVEVARYRAAPAEDCEYLIQKLCDWLNSDQFKTNTDLGLAVPILKATLAHLYIAWIHPFGDGNGRTARLLEFFILSSAGVPAPAAHLFSNHYNLTRSRYLKELDRASRSGGDVIPFLHYAVKGFVEQLVEQIKMVQGQQLIISWRDYVYEIFPDGSPSVDRKRKLLLAMSWRPPVKLKEVRGLSARLAEMYATKTDKTAARDINDLEKLKLIERVGGAYRARTEIIFGFLPRRRWPGMAKVAPLATPAQSKVSEPDQQP